MASLTAGNRRPVRLADIAKAAGVSHGTASNVFSRPEIVREEVRERVKAAALAMSASRTGLRLPAVSDAIVRAS